MDTKTAASSFQALSQHSRVEALRLLIQAGTEGMLAGDIGAHLGVRQNTMSAHLGVLLQSGLICNRREGRAIRYFADLDGIRQLVAFLLEDCCNGNTEICQPILDHLQCDPASTHTTAS